MGVPCLEAGTGAGRRETRKRPRHPDGSRVPARERVPEQRKRDEKEARKSGRLASPCSGARTGAAKERRARGPKVRTARKPLLGSGYRSERRSKAMRYGESSRTIAAWPGPTIISRSWTQRTGRLSSNLGAEETSAATRSRARPERRERRRFSRTSPQTRPAPAPRTPRKTWLTLPSLPLPSPSRRGSICPHLSDSRRFHAPHQPHGRVPRPSNLRDL